MELSHRSVLALGNLASCVRLYLCLPRAFTVCMPAPFVLEYPFLPFIVWSTHTYPGLEKEARTVTMAFRGHCD